MKIVGPLRCVIARFNCNQRGTTMNRSIDDPANGMAKGVACALRLNIALNMIIALD